MKKETKKVNLKESEMIEMISKIVRGAVAHEKKNWIAEQEKKNKAILESKIEEIKKSLLK